MPNSDLTPNSALASQALDAWKLLAAAHIRACEEGPRNDAAALEHATHEVWECLMQLRRYEDQRRREEGEING